MRDQRRLHVEPLRTLGAVVPSQPGQVLGRLCILELLEVLGRREVGLDLVEVSVRRVSVSGG